MPKALFAERKKMPWGCLLIFVIFIIVIAGGLFLNSALNSYPKKERVMLTVPSLPDRLENLRLLHVSDLDGRLFGDRQKSLTDLIKSDNYHAVFVTGDITDKNGSPNAMLTLMEGLPKDVPVFFVAGDEDPKAQGFENLPAWVATLKSAGATYVDRPIKWEVNKSVVWILPADLLTADSEALRFSLNEQGLGNSYGMQIVQALDNARGEMLPEHSYIAISHVPVSQETLAYLNTQDGENIRMQFFPGRLQVILSGHLNRGQFLLPGFGALYSPMTVSSPAGGFFPDDNLISGKINMRGVVQHISPGLGVSESYPKLLRMRLFNPPTISLLVLTKDFY
ncbi:MAG: metallophosphoesterase [Eubacteriales bacterium]|nr:metallophosphoesterase [Eubacteriales bacterium]